MIRKFQKKDSKAWCQIRKENLLKINSYNYPEEIINFLLCTNKVEKEKTPYQQRKGETDPGADLTLTAGR